ncbi:MAG: DUF2142 domain-containing protein [Acidimicrobiales bacterium]
MKLDWLPGRSYLRWFVPLLLLTMAFALASPLWGPPDEPSQLLQAAAVVRGELLGPSVSYGLGYPDQNMVGTQVRVPAELADNAPHPFPCFFLNPDETAGCAYPPVPESGDVTTTTYQGRYPPLYYFLVGWPTYLPSVRAAVYGIRLLSAALVSVLLAGAFYLAAASRRRPLLLAAVAVSATPEAMFMAGAVNPSGLEIAAAICAWTAGLVYVFDAPERRRASLHWLGASMVILMLTRPLGPALVLAIVATLFLLAGSALRQRLHDPLLLRWAGALAVSLVCALGWIAVAQPFATASLLHDYPLAAGTSLGSLLLVSVGHLGDQFTEIVGQTGWNVRLLPIAIYWLELAILGFFLTIALGARPIRGRLAVGGLLAASILLPVIANATQATTLGLVWEGRYVLPLAAGILVVAAYLGSTEPGGEPLLRRCAVPILVAAGAIQVVAVYAELRRFMVGDAGSLLLRHPGWSPPLPALLLILAGLVAEVFLVRAAIASLRPAPEGEPRLS